MQNDNGIFISRGSINKIKVPFLGYYAQLSKTTISNYFDNELQKVFF